MVKHKRVYSRKPISSLTGNGEKGDKVTLTFPMEEKWVIREHHNKYISYTLPKGEIMYSEEPTDRIPYAFTRGPVVYCLDMVWNKQIGNDDLNFEKDIRVDISWQPKRVEKPYLHMLGPVYQTKASYKGTNVTIYLTPFTDSSQWFRPNEQKPNKNADAFTYGIWLYKEGTK